MSRPQFIKQRHETIFKLEENYISLCLSSYPVRWKKAAGSARGGSTTLATETVTSPLVGC